MAGCKFTPCLLLHGNFYEIGEKTMLSAQKLLSTLNEIKDISNLDLALFHSNGKVVVYTKDMENAVEGVVMQFLESDATQQNYEDYQLYKIDSGGLLCSGGARGGFTARPRGCEI